MADKDDGERKGRSAEIWSTLLVSSVNETATTLRNGKRWVSLFKCSPQLGCSSFNSKISFIHLANFQQKAFLNPPKFIQFSCKPGRSACCSLIGARWLFFIIFFIGQTTRPAEHCGASRQTKQSALTRGKCSRGSPTAVGSNGPNEAS